ncbi:chromosome transmission fidelity protein 18 homolog [Lolium rigidum]|uniref:chromosome transmission fidelity protein 18 homolog n=1 Tax=Lolium rigidum TaxID=89674 RepID=UPI001F5E2AE7|nr:chromosome transmission fidelity protein 18 homolog [Lolium rigidum]
MEVDMDMPDPEELEWMESNGLLPEEEEYAYFDDPEEGFLPAAAVASKPQDPPQVAAASPAKPAEEVPEANLKRPPPPPPPEQEEERSKRRNVEREDPVDEDWLRYSPPPAAEVVAEKTVSRFASEIQGDSMPVTAPNGERVYAKLATEKLVSEVIEGARRRASNTNHTGLLSESFQSLTMRAEQDALAKALLESTDTQYVEGCPVTPVVTEQLWVEKYAPHSFTELLSDEHTNREVLLWLKQWDSCVFGSHIRATSDDTLSALRQHSCAIQKNSSNRSFFSKIKGGYVTSRDSMPQNESGSNSEDLKNNFNKKPSVDNAPEQKVLLLCGPAGLGKTTLAHVAAKHCGYHVVEINASDDRSASSIEPKILDVVQMNSIMSDSKPKCLVIDEIDGALGDGKGAVEVILKMINAEKNKNSDSSTGTDETPVQKASTRKGHKIAKLLRPIICICNDLYAPALRKLRQVAKVHIFVQPTISRVVNRLKYICKKEGFKTSSIALSALADYTECDIRSCLNTLQFLNKKREALNISGFESQVIGRKDMSKSIFDVWKQVLQKKKPKRAEMADSHVSGDKDIGSLFSLISNRGDYDVTMDGIHENLLRLSYHDPMLQKTVKCLDVLGVSDSLTQYVYRTQHMSIQAYQPSIAITISRMVAQVEKPNIEWPKALQRCRAVLLEKKDTLKTWQNRMSPLISRHLSVESFVEDIASPFLHILSPLSLRPVALNLQSERAKNELVQLVDTMVAYSVTYRNTKFEPQERANGYIVPTDIPSLSLDPPISDIISFKGYQSEHIGLSLAVKQVLVHEVEKQKIMKDSAGKLLNQTSEAVTSEVSTVTCQEAAAVTALDSSKGSSKLKSATVPMQFNSASSLRGKDMAPAKKPSSRPTDFFHSFRKERPAGAKSHNDAAQQGATVQRDLRPLIFKYNEGYTNAVKRPVRVRDLLL